MRNVTPSFTKDMKFLLIAGLLLLPFSVMAQSIFISDATVHTMGSHGVLQETDLLIREGHIKAIGPGLTALTRIFRSASSRASTRVIVLIAPFVEL